MKFKSDEAVVFIVKSSEGSWMPAFLANKKVFVLPDQPIPVTDMQVDKIAVVASDDGTLWHDPVDKLLRDIKSSGTTPLLLASDAWKISSLRFKETLISKLGAVPEESAVLLDNIVRHWGVSQGRTYRDGDVVASTNELANIKRESFDFTVSAYRSFVKAPEDFNWKGGAVHDAAIRHLRNVIRGAFETEMSGPWADAASEDDGNLLDPASPKTMSTRMFNILVDECYAALKVRQARNENGAHPLQGSDKEARDHMLKLYERAVRQKLYVLDDFHNLAKAAVPHVRERLEGMGSVSATRPSGGPGVPVVDLRQK